MPNINKVVYGNTTLIDLSTTTLSETSQLANGITAYDRAGNVITGTASGGGTGAVVIEDTTDSHGGTVRTITAVNISDTTAVAADVAQGKYFYDATGTKTAGTSTGGGSSGALYKKGTYTPSSTYSSTGNREITTLANIGFTPKKFVFYVTNRSNLSGKSAVILYTMCDIDHMVRFNIRYSNTSGTTSVSGGLTSWTMQSNGMLYCDGTAVYYRTSSSYTLVADVEYTWEAFG